MAFSDTVREHLSSEAATWLLALGCCSSLDVAYMWADGGALYSDYASTCPQDFAGACQLVAFWSRCHRLSSIDVATCSSEVQLCRRSILPFGPRTLQGYEPLLQARPKGAARALVPWRVSSQPVATTIAQRDRPLRPSDSLRNKCVALFVVLYQYILDAAEIGFPVLNLSDADEVWRATQLVLGGAMRLSEGHIATITAGLKRWIRFAVAHSVDIRRPHARDLASFLQEVSKGGPTAAASLWQMFRWLRSNVGAEFDVEHFLVRPFRLHAPGHVQQQRDELEPWEFANMLICAAELTGCPRTLAAFCIMSAASCVRFRHMQRSVFFRDHGAWLEFRCAMGKSRRQGVRPPYHWALPQLVFEGFDLLAEIRPVVVRQSKAGADFLWPRPVLTPEELWQVVELTPLDVGRQLSPSRFMEFFRGLLSRCGLPAEEVARAGYNRLRRFLPTGGSTLGLDEISMQAIGSWTEPAQAQQGAKRQKLMSTHYAGNKLDNSLQAKQQVLQAVVRAIRRMQGHRKGSPQLFPSQSLLWSHVTAPSLSAPRGHAPKKDSAATSEISSSQSSSSSSGEAEDLSSSGEEVLPVADVDDWAWFQQRAKFHVVQCRDDGERLVPFCRKAAFPQDPTRTGSGLPPMEGAVCQRCLRSVPKLLKARLLESRGL
ncbi:ppsA [Symbiodinium natans]|uniref:PpsA protein n=1 Tax=Symbiodinium natans TaxID=878477 RepID=A0A812NBI8_9DINO|nr:ppsA [Symbiodinium natans]